MTASEAATKAERLRHLVEDGRRRLNAYMQTSEPTMAEFSRLQQVANQIAVHNVTELARVKGVGTTAAPSTTPHEDLTDETLTVDGITSLFEEAADLVEEFVVPFVTDNLVELCRVDVHAAHRAVKALVPQVQV